jgi:hypothetical protein
VNVTPLFDALFLKIQPFLMGVLNLTEAEVLRGPINRAATPRSPGGYVVMTPLFEKRLRTNVSVYDDTGDPGPPVDQGTRAIEQGTEIHVQFDFYGPTGGDWGAIVSTVFRDSYGVEALAPECAPLYIDDVKNAPLVTGEAQYQERFVCTARFQYNPTVTIPQQFADSAVVELVEVDTEFPPED